MRKVLLIFMMTVAGYIAVTAKGDDPEPQPCLGEVDATVTLFFGACDYPARQQGYPCGPVPRPACDPRTFVGTNNPTSAPSKWHLRIVVDGDVDPSCPEKHKVYTPTTASMNYSWPIKVPKDKPYKVTVEFYEDQNTCGTNLNGRPKFVWTSGGSMSGTQINAMLKYDGTK